MTTFVHMNLFSNRYTDTYRNTDIEMGYACISFWGKKYDRNRMIWVWLRWYGNTFQSSQYFWKIDIQVIRGKVHSIHREHRVREGPDPQICVQYKAKDACLDSARCPQLSPGLKSLWATLSQIWALKYVAWTSPRTTQLWSWSPGCRVHITNQDVLSEDEWTNGRSKLTFWITREMGPPYGRG